MKTKADVNIDTTEYDFIIAGAGLYGAVMARELTDECMKVLVIEKRDHIGGNCYTEEEDGIVVHKCGPHIFHTNDEEVWRYVNRFADFIEFRNRPLAVYKDERYPLPIDMSTFETLLGVSDPDEAKSIIRKQAEAYGLAGKEPGSLEEQAVSMVGTELYEKLIKGYSEKQWGRSCSELPASIIKRLQVSFGYADSYYPDRYQGIPAGGYTPMIERMLDGIPVVLGKDHKSILNGTEDHHGNGAVCNNTDYHANPVSQRRNSDQQYRGPKIIYTGSIDEYYGYCLGMLGYRSVRFEEEYIYGITAYQDRAVINHTDADVPYTRVTEHKYFDPGLPAFKKDFTIITREYPQDLGNKYSEHIDPLRDPEEHKSMHPVKSEKDPEPMYPVRSDADLRLYERYRKLAEEDNEYVFFGGRLGTYRYMDMDDVIASAIGDARFLCKQAKEL